jgi:hypothetical protein
VALSDFSSAYRTILPIGTAGSNGRWFGWVNSMAETELEAVRWRVHEHERFVAEQRARVEEAVAGGQNADLAKAVLLSLERELSRHQQHLQRLMELHKHVVDRQV